MEYPTLQNISFTDEPSQDVKLTSYKHSAYSVTTVIVTTESSNGNIVNGDLLEKYTKYKLKPGDVISLGETINYIFKLPERKSSILTKPITEDKILDTAASVIENSGAFKDDCVMLSNTERAGPSAQSTGSGKLKNTNNSSPSTVGSARKREHSSDENADNSDSKKQKLDDIQDELQCSICTEMFVNAQTLSCSHTFCKYCIEQWKKNHMLCPICRAKITSLFPSLVIDTIVERIIENSSKEIQDQRRDAVGWRNAVPRTSAINTATVSNTATASNTASRRTNTYVFTEYIDEL